MCRHWWGGGVMKKKTSRTRRWVGTNEAHMTWMEARACTSEDGLTTGYFQILIPYSELTE